MRLYKTPPTNMKHVKWCGCVETTQITFLNGTVPLFIDMKLVFGGLVMRFKNTIISIKKSSHY